MASTTIRYSGLPGNSHSGGDQIRRPGVPAYLEQVVYPVEPDQNMLGAYRYDPESHDPTIPDSDPRSPRYEPPHLRHRPGDTWIIDRDRPDDPLNPGPSGSPGWYADKRTGRHRRGELPDPPVDGRRPSLGPFRDGTGERPSMRSSGDEPPQPPRRPRPRYGREEDDSRYDFGKLREDAWRRFMVESQELHRSHFIRSASDNRWRKLWEAFCAFVLQVLGFRTRSAVPDPVNETSTLVLPTVACTAASFRGTPSQGPHRTSPISPYIAQWERHFDAGQAFREAVAL
jgi:hypothetical protein